MKIPPLMGLLVRLPSNVLWVETLYTFVSSKKPNDLVAQELLIVLTEKYGSAQSEVGGHLLCLQPHQPGQELDDVQLETLPDPPPQHVQSRIRVVLELWSTLLSQQIPPSVPPPSTSFLLFLGIMTTFVHLGAAPGGILGLHIIDPAPRQTVKCLLI